MRLLIQAVELLGLLPRPHLTRCVQRTHPSSHPYENGQRRVFVRGPSCRCTSVISPRSILRERSLSNISTLVIDDVLLVTDFVKSQNDQTAWSIQLANNNTYSFNRLRIEWKLWSQLPKVSGTELHVIVVKLSFHINYS